MMYVNFHLNKLTKIGSNRNKKKVSSDFDSHINIHVGIYPEEQILK